MTWKRFLAYALIAPVVAAAGCLVLGMLAVVVLGMWDAAGWWNLVLVAAFAGIAILISEDA